MPNPHVASNLMKPITERQYGNVSNGVHQLLLYIFEVFFHYNWGLVGYQKLKFGQNQYSELGEHNLQVLWAY